MKKFLAGCGVIALVLVVLGGAGIGYMVYQGVKLDSSATAFANEQIPPILTNWSAGQLWQLTSPGFRKVCSQPQNVEFFRKFATLGGLKSYDKATGNSGVNYTPSEGKVVSAHLTMHAVFEKGDAEIKIELIRLDDQWTVQGFRIDSPFFLK